MTAVPQTTDSSIEAKLELARLRRHLKSKLVLAFDGLVPDSKPTPVQESILKDAETQFFWILGGSRSGKSTTGGRIISWFFNDCHPYMERPKEWGKGPLQLLVVGRLVEQMESELWEKKIRPFVNDTDIQIVRIGGSLQRVVNRRNGNRIIFLSHHDAKNAREKIQAFTAHVAWLDEMPDDVGLVTELMFRVMSTRGRFYATFTPLLKNEEIRKIVDTDVPGSRKIKLSMLDNPVYRGREAEVEAQARAHCNSDAEFRARMYGDWWYGTSRVFVYDRARHWQFLPAHYTTQGWRHLAVLDPAASGLAGLTVWGEDPQTGRWYNVVAKYLKGAAAFDLFNMAEAEVAPFQGAGLLRRCDCNPAGFYKEAARRGIPWLAYTEKNDRKLETVDKFNTNLLSGKMCLTPASMHFEEELVKATWSERDPNKIQGSSQYHLCDTARYAADVLPEWDPRNQVVFTQTQEIRQTWKTRLAVKAKAIADQRYKITQRRNQWARPNRH